MTKTQKEGVESPPRFLQVRRLRVWGLESGNSRKTAGGEGKIGRAQRSFRDVSMLCMYNVRYMSACLSKYLESITMRMNCSVHRVTSVVPLWWRILAMGRLRMWEYG